MCKEYYEVDKHFRKKGLLPGMMVTMMTMMVYATSS